ncbi:hypothetical protein [Aquimarina longa]|uniref:hypothetical protein n=1 Tax=Aquimarina longa TaxID=1080221 RepID=UPI000B198495|nr:hypothetical protein [Aquimarina longa]
MKILKVNSSGAKEKSISRKEVNTIVSRLLIRYPNAEVINRDVAYDNLPFPNDKFIEAILHNGELTDKQKKRHNYQMNL